ncbi:hypothetical protein ACLKA7_007468 [Drosophila subpalustris]
MPSPISITIPKAQMLSFSVKCRGISFAGTLRRLTRALHLVGISLLALELAQVPNTGHLASQVESYPSARSTLAKSKIATVNTAEDNKQLEALIYLLHGG